MKKLESTKRNQEADVKFIKKVMPNKEQIASAKEKVPTKVVPKKLGLGCIPISGD